MGNKIIALNKKAKHDYFLYDRFEAGIVLTGTEIKSIRLGKVQFKDAYISIINREAFIKEMNIALYKEGNINNHDETRVRKLLLNNAEIVKLRQKLTQQGYTIVPCAIYLKNGRAKVEIALAKGKALYDKRQSEKEQTAKREIEKAIKNKY